MNSFARQQKIDGRYLVKEVIQRIEEYKKRLKLNERPKILLASRLLWSKGVGDYVDLFVRGI